MKEFFVIDTEGLSGFYAAYCAQAAIRSYISHERITSRQCAIEAYSSEVGACEPQYQIDVASVVGYGTDSEKWYEYQITPQEYNYGKYHWEDNGLILKSDSVNRTGMMGLFAKYIGAECRSEDDICLISSSDTEMRFSVGIFEKFQKSPDGLNFRHKVVLDSDNQLDINNITLAAIHLSYRGIPWGMDKPKFIEEFVDGIHCVTTEVDFLLPSQEDVMELILVTG